eukprot:5411248-Prymnesium_polylepis.1
MQAHDSAARSYENFFFFFNKLTNLAKRLSLPRRFQKDDLPSSGKTAQLALFACTILGRAQEHGEAEPHALSSRAREQQPR